MWLNLLSSVVAQWLQPIWQHMLCWSQFDAKLNMRATYCLKLDAFILYLMPFRPFVSARVRCKTLVYLFHLTKSHLVFAQLIWSILLFIWFVEKHLFIQLYFICSSVIAANFMLAIYAMLTSVWCKVDYESYIVPLVALPVNHASCLFCVACISDGSDSWMIPSRTDTGYICYSDYSCWKIVFMRATCWSHLYLL
jgi:hypothetical protein